MKFYSKIFKAKTVVSVFIIIWVIILILITINHTLSCVDTKGYLKTSCQKCENKKYTPDLRSTYSNLVKIRDMKCKD